MLNRPEFKVNITFKCLIYYFEIFFKDYYKNKIEFDFSISCILNDQHVIEPILLKLVAYKSNIYNGKIYKNQDGNEKDITNDTSILVTPLYNKKEKVLKDVNFFNVILVEELEEQAGGKLKKGQKKIKSKKSVVSQNKENKYKDVLGKRMKIYEKPDSRKEFVRYKGELVALVEYKKSMKEIAKKQNAKK
jgi:hypothetical protein